METWTTTQGSSDPFTAQLRNEDESPYAGYTGAEEITVVVSAGDGQAAIPGVALATWLFGPAGTITVSMVGSATQTLEPATYVLELWILDACVYRVNVEVNESAGNATPRVAKITIKQMKRFAPWLEKLLPKLDDPSALEARASAWDWFQDLLHRHYRSDCGLSPDYAFVPGFSYGATMLNVYRDGRRSRRLQEWLDAGGLDLTAPVIDAMCYYAIAQVCESQIDPGKETNNYADFAVSFAAKAENAVLCITAEIDTNGDGKNDTTIRLGVTDTLDG